MECGEPLKTYNRLTLEIKQVGTLYKSDGIRDYENKRWDKILGY